MTSILTGMSVSVAESLQILSFLEVLRRCTWGLLARITIEIVSRESHNAFFGVALSSRVHSIQGSVQMIGEVCIVTLLFELTY